MNVIIDTKELETNRKKLTFQNELPAMTDCKSCGKPARLIMLIDDENGELAENPPVRIDGIPIHPHDSCIFALYMCTECGEITTIWNQG